MTTQIARAFLIMAVLFGFATALTGIFGEEEKQARFARVATAYAAIACALFLAGGQ